MNKTPLKRTAGKKKIIVELPGKTKENVINMLIVL